MENLLKKIKLIPEPLINNGYSGISESHCLYRRRKNDYWHCPCAGRGQQLKPPSTIEEFLHWVREPEKVRDWYEKYHFNVIIAGSFCGREYYTFGHQTDKYKFAPEEDDSDEVFAETHHAFYIKSDGRFRLINFQEDLYSDNLFRIRRKKISHKKRTSNGSTNVEKGTQGSRITIRIYTKYRS